MKLSKIKTSDWITIAITAVVLLACLLLIESTMDSHPVWQSVLSSTSSIIGVSIILGCISNRVLTVQIMKYMCQAHDCTDQPSQLGLTTIQNNDDIDYKKLIDEAKNITILCVYNNTWLNKYHNQLGQFLCSRKGKLTIIFSDPDTPDTAVLNAKFNIGANVVDYGLQDKIRANITNAKQLLQSGDGSKSARKRRAGVLKIFSQPFVPPYSAFVFDDTIIMIPYRATPGRGTVFGYQFTKNGTNGLYENYTEDIKSLIESHTTELYPNAKN